MEAFTTHQGIAVPLPRTHINTDDIIPASFLKAVSRSGFSRGLFANWRFLPDSQELNPDFVLNKPRYSGASVLVTGENFGCGSSREHAPWALAEYGFKAIIAPTFADIFYNNCFNIGLLPIQLPEAAVEALTQAITEQEGYSIFVDLPNQQVKGSDGQSYTFDLDQFRKTVLVQGLDPIARTLLLADDISAFESQQRARSPWLVAQ